VIRTSARRGPLARRWLRRRPGRLAGLLVVGSIATFGLTACTSAASVGALRQGDTAVILVGYQCDKSGGRLQNLSVGEQDGSSSGPALWTISAQRAAPTPEVTVGVVPTGYTAANDSLGTGGVGLSFWVQSSSDTGSSSAATFDLSKLKDGQLMDSSGTVISKATFDKRYKCSS
jgi:hypothetical protein